MNYIAKIQDRLFEINLEDHGDQIIANIDKESIPIQITELDGNHIYSVLLGNRSLELEIRPNETGYLLHYQGNTLECYVEDERMARLKKSMDLKVTDAIVKELNAPMPGLIVSVEVKPGQQVKKGDGLVIIEAMKMENEIKATSDAIVKEIKVQKQQPVEKNQLLMIFE